MRRVFPLALIAAGASALAAAPAHATPSKAQCAAVRAERSLPTIVNSAPHDRAPRVFAIQLKQESRHVETIAAYARKIECTIRERVLPYRAKGRPNLVAFPEYVGLATIAAGPKGAAARASIADPANSPACANGGQPPCAAIGALQAVGTAYQSQVDEYTRRFGTLNPLAGALLGASDTVARAWVETFSTLAKKYDLYLSGSALLPDLRESTAPADIAAFGAPGAASAYVATGREVFNRVYLWGPKDVRRTGPAALRNAVARNDKVPLTDTEKAIGAAPGPATGAAARANVRPYRLPGTRARIAFATSLPAFVYGSSAGDPCADVSKTYMRCVDRLGTNVLIQSEANNGPWAAYTAKTSPDRGAWQSLSWNTSTWRTVAESTTDITYNVTPHLMGNLGDMPFDGQSAITQRALKTGRGCHYVGAGRVEGEDPATMSIGGGTQRTRDYAGRKKQFLALAPWVVSDAARSSLQRTGRGLLPGGSRENGYLEATLVADLPFPADQERRSCVTRASSEAR